jgi:hypothetical protein
VLIHTNALYHGIAEGFEAQDLADLIGSSLDKAQRLIDKTLRWNLISEQSTTAQEQLTADFDTKEKDNTLPSKSAVNRTYGRKATRYRLTPHLADDMIRRSLADYIQELMEAPDPGVIYAEESEQAGAQDAEAIQRISAAAASTVDGLEVTAKAERAAVAKARELLRRAEIDENPFATAELPCSVRGLRTMLIETLLATDPDRVWKHAEMMWIAGTTRHNVGALIAKSTKIMPAAQPTFLPVSFEGRAPLLAMEAACKAQHGAPVAWLDENGEILESFSPKPPKNARGGLINIGKKYIRREPVAASGEASHAPAQPVAEREEKAIQEPTEEAKQKARRAHARGVILPRLRGCLLARGWKHIPGPYGYWERHAAGLTQRAANTFDGMIEALLQDKEWALGQAELAQSEESA